MAYNQIPYNLSAYNLGAGEMIYLSAEGYESVQPNLTVNTEIHVLAIAYEAVSTDIEGVACLWVKASGNEQVVMNESQIQGDLAFALTIEETITGTAAVTSVDSFAVTGLEEISSTSILSETAHLSVTGLETVTADVLPTPNVFLTASGFEYVAVTASLEALDVKIAVLEVTLHPGQKLVIDSGNYTVLLDGENYIEAHSGDWLDELTRETVEISIGAASGAGNLSASILYTERYL